MKVSTGISPLCLTFSFLFADLNSKNDILKYVFANKAKEYYEASQLYISVATRLIKRDPEKGIRLFLDGCSTLAKEEQYECVSALGRKLAQHVSGLDNLPTSCKGRQPAIESADWKRIGDSF